MLQLSGRDWSTGRAELLFGRDIEHQATTLVSCTLGDLPTLAFLDTGSQRSVIGGAIAELLGGQLGASLGREAVSTRLGRVEGDLHRLPITLIATEGSALAFEATALIAPTWSGPPVVLGFYDALERVRLAFDPGDQETPPALYFGLSS